MTVALCTGGTGSFGSLFARHALSLGWQVRVFSRDELKQAELRKQLTGDVRFMLGDVRDVARLKWAARGADVVVHAAALKRVDACEYDPLECVNTNVVGTANVLTAAIDEKVYAGVLLSSDKAVHPVNTYGASKLLAEKVWVGGNIYGNPDSRFSVVRYGNIRGSRGSILEHAKSGPPLVIRDPDATRFWINQQQAVDLVHHAIEHAQGGEIYVPKLTASRLGDLLPNAPVGDGLEQGEKLHEQLISDEEARRTYDLGSHFLITSQEPEDGVRVPGAFRYVSGS